MASAVITDRRGGGKGQSAGGGHTFVDETWYKTAEGAAAVAILGKSVGKQ